MMIARKARRTKRVRLDLLPSTKLPRKDATTVVAGVMFPSSVKASPMSLLTMVTMDSQVEDLVATQVVIQDSSLVVPLVVPLEDPLERVMVLGAVVMEIEDPTLMQTSVAIIATAWATLKRIVSS
jgi:hypothetical protein